MLYTVTLGFRQKNVDEYAVPQGTYHRSYTVNAGSESEAFLLAETELKTELLIEAANVRPYAVSYERTEGRRVQDRLEFLRGELRAERISYGELAELQGLSEHIDPSDVELLEAAGVPEFPES